MPKKRHSAEQIIGKLRELDNPPENPDMPFLREEIALPASV